MYHSHNGPALYDLFFRPTHTYTAGQKKVHKGSGALGSPNAEVPRVVRLGSPNAGTIKKINEIIQLNLFGTVFVLPFDLT